MDTDLDNEYESSPKGVAVPSTREPIKSPSDREVMGSPPRIVDPGPILLVTYRPIDGKWSLV